MESVARDLFLTQHVRHPTHYRCEHTPTLIDLLLTNEEGMMRNLTHDPPIDKSHHQVLHFRFLCHIDDTASNTQEWYNCGVNHVKQL